MDDDAFEDAAAFGTGYALYRHGQDRLTAGIYHAVRAALAEWDPAVLTRGGDDEGSSRPGDEVVMPVDLTRHDMLQDWQEYIGQVQLIEELRLRVDSARIRHGRLPHTLLASTRSGMGRRAAIRLAARQLGRELVELCAPFTIDQLAQAVDHIRYADILFIDDLDRAHGPGAVGPGTLTNLFERCDVHHPNGGSHFVDEISIVASTTRPDDVATALLDRFPVHVAMADYSLGELAQLAVQFAFTHRSDELVSDEVAVRIGSLSKGNGPAAVEGLVLLVRDLAVTLGRPPEPEEITHHILRYTPDPIAAESL